MSFLPAAIVRSDSSFWLPVEVNSIRPELSTSPKLAWVDWKPGSVRKRSVPSTVSLLAVGTPGSASVTVDVAGMQASCALVGAVPVDQLASICHSPVVLAL